MIKNILSLMALAVLSAFPAATFAQGGAFSVKGKINGFEGKYIHMLYENNGALCNDSVKITNGQFAFSGKISTSMAMSSIAIGNFQDPNNRKLFYLYVEPKAMTVTIDKDRFNEPVVTGSFTQLQADSLDAMDRSMRDQMSALRDEQKTLKDSAAIAEIDRRIDGLQSKAVSSRLSWLKNNPNSLLAPMQMRFYMGKMSFDEITAIYNRFTPEVKQMPYCREIEKEIDVLKTIRPRLPAPYFRAKSDKGEMISPADLKGKYVLLDFWATWCVPCRKSFPHVKALYAKYKSKGFDVFCVADDDGNEARWKAAIKKDGIENFHHVLRGLKWDRSKGIESMDNTNDISDKYAVHYLPTKYLIDREGRLVGKFDDAQLDAKLKVIFGF